MVYPLINNRPTEITHVSKFNNLLGVLCFLMPFWCHADKNLAFLSEDDFFDEIPIVLSPARLEQPANESPIATTVIDRAMIEASGATDIPELLRLVPGMAVGYQDDLSVTASYHGLSGGYSRRMQVQIDGRTVYDPIAGLLPWQNLAIVIDDIERIEIIRGPNAATHGANAFLGIISIKTRQSSSDKGIYANISHGTNGIRKRTLRYGHAGDRVDYKVTMESRENDGFASIPDTSEIKRAIFRSDIRLTNSDTIIAQAGISNLEGENCCPFSPVHILKVENSFQQLKWLHKTSNNNELRFQMFHNSFTVTEDWETRGLVYDRDTKADRYDFELQHTIAFGLKHRLVWGAGYRQDTTSDIISFNTTEKQKIDIYRGFISAESQLTQNIILNTGVMIEKHSFVGTDYSPRTSLNYHFLPNHTFRTSYSRAFRNPVLVEEKGSSTFKDADGNVVFTLFDASGGLDHEQIDSLEVGYYGRAPKQKTTIDIKVYRDNITNLIRSFSDPVTRAIDFRNRDWADIYGAELQIVYQPKLRTRIYSTYSYEIVKSSDLDGNFSDTAPTHKFSLLALHRLSNGIEGSAAYYYNSDMQWLGSDPVDSYSRIDFRLAKYFHFNKTDADIAIVVQNVLDKKIADFDPDSTVNRRAYLTATVHFQ